MEEEVTSSQEYRLSQESFDSVLLYSLCPDEELPLISDSELQNLQSGSQFTLTRNLVEFSDGKSKQAVNQSSSSKVASGTIITSMNTQSLSVTPVPVTELPREVIDSLAIKYPPSSLPATNNWPGKYDFQLFFHSQEKKTKAVSWMYSETREKLYVAKNVPCPISFMTNCRMPSDTKIRAMPVFTQSEHSSEIVRRCVNHAIADATSGVQAPEHLVRCECPQVSYEIDETTGRQSVVVPYENPGTGDDTSTYIFKFACFGSCAGGLNRRPIMVIFTLERGNTVIGRKSLDVKICACPGRDCKNDDMQASSSHEGRKRVMLKRKEPDSTNLADVFNFVNNIQYPSSKKSQPVPNKDGFYTITVRNRELHDFLNQVKALYEMVQTLRNLSPELQRLLQNKLKIKREKRSTDESD